MSFPLSDIQKLVVEQLEAGRERDLLVSAGAGSGKTTILVESVLAALQQGVSLDRLLVVTFTDKAATEMRNKIYRALGQREDLAHHRLRLPQARISTIHSFCQRLLREHFDRAGVDPRFRVLSAEDAQLSLDDATTRVFHARYERGLPGKGEPIFEQLVEMCGFDADGEKLRGVVRDLLARARASEEPEHYLDRHAVRLAHKPESWDDLVWRRDYARRIAGVWREAEGLLRALVEELPAAAKWTAFLRAIEEVDPAGLGTPDGQRAAVARLDAGGFVKGTDPLKIAVPSVPSGQGDRLGPLRRMVSEAFASPWIAEMPIDEERVLREESEASRYAFGLIHLAREVGAAYDAAKSRIGALDFEDLEIRALQLVGRLAGTEEAIRFDRVFIDEFQDVNGLQHRLLEQLCDPTRIFRVGDVKQSIYQFRLADPTIIRGLGRDRPLVRERAEAPDAIPAWNVLLPKNYRSLPPVIRVANEIARGIFFEDEIGTAYERQALVAGRAPSPEDPDVELLAVRDPSAASGNGAEGGEPAEENAAEEKTDLHDAEWGAIAERIRQLIASGTVLDGESGRPRPIVYSDIAILMRAHARAPALARRLEEEGIPCSAATGESFFEATEVRDITNLLRAVDNLLDDITLAAALRSPAFQWADAELFAARLAYPGAMHLAFALAALADSATGDDRHACALFPDDAESRKVLLGEPVTLPEEPPFSTLPVRAAEALGAFLRWRDAAGWSELPDLVGKILSETGLPRSVASLPGGLRRRGNLRKFHGIARRYARDAGPSLTRFIRWCDLLREGKAKIFEAPVSSESVPAVRILTVHKAKGLEFPVVILAEMGRRYQLGARANALVPGRDYLGVRLLDRTTYLLRQTVPLRLLADAARDDDLAEEKRVLYVALTRARDRLILSGIVESRSAVSEFLHQVYRTAVGRTDEDGRATVRHLLMKKAQPISWALYTLPALPASDGTVAGLPLRVHWVPPKPRVETPPTPNRIRAIEDALRRGAQVEIPGGEDREAAAAVTLAARETPLPSPGLLATARGKIWATEFKSGRDIEAVIEGADATEGAPDEPATPLIPPEAAATEGTLIHAVLERIELPGLDPGNIDARIADATAAVGGVSDEIARMLRRSLTRLLALPIGPVLTTNPTVHREVAFSLRLPLLDVARWLPDLRAEILASPDWMGWVGEADDGGLRIARDGGSGAAAPWVLVQGRIDLILASADGWIVLDWKSDRVTEGETLERRVEMYKGQMEIYRRAVQSLFGSPVSALLYFLRPGILRVV
jgi:ATP-dependent helicase/nuclease subunit A